MTKDDVLHLARLSRIALTDQEVTTFTTEIDAVLAYVGQVNEIVAKTGVEKTVGPVHNVFREDVVTTPSGTHADTLLQAFPDRKDDFLRVPRILNPDN